MNLLLISKNDKRARIIIFTFSLLVLIIVSLLDKFRLHVSLGFDANIFAKASAVINTLVAILLIAGLYAAKNRYYERHRIIMLSAMTLSVIFLLCYICQHLFTPETRFGDIDHNGVLSNSEKLASGNLRYVYYVLLGTHILLAGIVLPFILFTAYRALINENENHRKLAKITWPVWFYVAVTGPIVYLMICPYF